MNQPKFVTIRELGPREGFQTLEKVVSTKEKLELINILSETGVREIEVASFVKAEKVPQMADAEEVVKGLNLRKGVIYKGLYLNRKGYERVVSSAKLSKQGWLNVATSATFLRHNANITLSEVLADIPEWQKVFSANGESCYGVMLSTAFGCNYEGEVPAERALSVLSTVYEKIASTGNAFKEVCLADTMGWGTPHRVKSLIDMVRSKFPGLTVSLHLHDTRGTGMANVYAGLESGIEVFECSVAGLGGCPFAKGAAGNVCSEDVAFMCEEMGIKTGVNLKTYIEAAKLAEQLTGSYLPGKLYKTAQKVDVLTLRKS